MWVESHRLLQAVRVRPPLSRFLCLLLASFCSLSVLPRCEPIKSERSTLRGQVVFLLSPSETRCKKLHNTSRHHLFDLELKSSGAPTEAEQLGLSANFYICSLPFLSLFDSLFLPEPRRVYVLCFFFCHQDDFLFSVSIVSGLSCAVLAVAKFMLGKKLTSRALITDGRIITSTNTIQRPSFCEGKLVFLFMLRMTEC